MTTFDIFHITFNEANQEENWLRVLELHPNARRIHGILGIDKAHMACNALSTTEHFWTIDGDNWLTETLDWEPDPARDLIWFYAQDPVLGVRVKNGGVKLWRKDCFVNTDMSQGDFSVAATAAKISPDKVLSITRYNTIPYDAWKTSFRHCVKLLSRIFRDRPLAVNVEKYLDIWKSYQHLDNGTNNAIWCYRGYLDAEQYVKLCDNDLNLLYKINDYKWLINHFNSRQHD